MDPERKSANIGNFILILIAMVLGVVIGLMFRSHTPVGAGQTLLQSKMSEVVDLVETQYVDPLDTDSLSESLLPAMLAELDPHSSYLSAKESARNDEMLRGNFEGVGLMLRTERDSVFISHVLPDGPSAASGVLPGDLIWAVDGRQVSGVGMSPDSVVARLRGPRRSSVTVTLLRDKPVDITLHRGVVAHKTLLHHAMIDDTTGYIILSSFSSTSHDEFHAALRDLKRQGMRHLMFDLRGNNGGALSSAIGIAGEMLPSGRLIVYTQGEHQRRQNIYSTPGGLFTQGKVTILVDERSASASEVVSGALQDNDRALIVGRRTFGKGLVQREFTLNDGSSVLLTVARYYTPSGRSIQRPYDGGTDEYYRDYIMQLVEESYADNPTLHVTDSTPYYTVSGRTVYGGGGIFPDRLIPYRKDSSLVYYNQLTSNGLLTQTAFAEVRRHAAELLRRYPDANHYCRHYQVSEALIQQLVQRGEEAGIARNPQGLNAQRKLIATMLKAYIGDFLYGSAAFYPLVMKEDNDLMQALQQK